MEPQLEPLEAIYRTHRTPLRKKLVRHGVRFVDADDVLHDLFSSLQRGLADGTSMPTNLVGWVYAAAYNKAVDYIKQHRLQLERYAPLDMDALPPHDTAPSPDSAEQLALEERRRFLYAALKRMPPELLVVFEHRVLYGLTSAQTAEILELNETTVSSRYKALLEFLEEEYARWCARQSRTGALLVPFGLASLLAHESGRLDGQASDTPDGGWMRFLAHAGFPIKASGAAAQVALWHAKVRSVVTFVGGVIVGAAALWLFLNLPGLRVPPPHERGKHTSGSPSMEEPSASAPHRESLSGDEPHGEATQQATPPETPRATAGRTASSSVTTPSTAGRDAHSPMSEQDLIIAAHTAIEEGRFAHARALLMRHASKFPRSEMKSARDALLAALPQ